MPKAASPAYAEIEVLKIAMMVTNKLRLNFAIGLPTACPSASPAGHRFTLARFFIDGALRLTKVVALGGDVTKSLAGLAVRGRTEALRFPSSICQMHG